MQRTSILSATTRVVVGLMACALVMSVCGVRAMGIDRAEIESAERAEFAAADAMDGLTLTPPPPPYDSVMLEIEARIAAHDVCTEQSARVPERQCAIICWKRLTPSYLVL